MATAGDLAISLKVNSEGLVEGIKVATKSVDGVAQQFRSSFGTVGSAVASAAKEHHGFVGVLKEFKSEQVQQARTARFLANEITSIIPASAGASGAMQGLLGAGLELAAGGGALAVGFELTKVVLEQVVHKLDAAAERAKAFRAAQFSTIEGLRNAYEGLADSLAQPLTKTAAVSRDESRKAVVEIRKLNEELRALQHEGGWSAWWGDVFGGKNTQQIDLTRSKIAGIVSGNRAGAPGAEAAADAAERASQAREASAQILQIEASTAGEIERLRADLAAKLKDLDWNAAKYGEQTGAVRLALEAQTNEQIRRARAAQARAYREAEVASLSDILSEKAKIEAAANIKVLALAEQWRQTKDQKEKDSLKNQAVMVQDRARRDIGNLETKRGLDTNIEPELGAYRKQREDSQQQIGESLTAGVDAVQEKWQGLFSGLASGWGNTLKGMLSGAQSFGDGIKVIFSEILDQFLSVVAQMAAKWLIFNTIASFVTGGGGFGSIGLGKILGFASGGSFDGRAPFVVGERGPEVVVPGGRGGTVVPNHALGGVTISINAMDGASVQRVVESDAFRRAIREAYRNGRGA